MGGRHVRESSLILSKTQNNRPVKTAIRQHDITDCAAACGARAILRGIRSMKDYEFELQMADINRRLTGIETVLLFTEPELASVSSSMVRELAHFGRDVSDFLPYKL